MVLAFCGPAVTEEEVTEEEEVAAKEEVAPAVEVPQYGGTLTHAEDTDPQYWDYLTVSGPSQYG